ncbi:anthrone oxygenase family protein [Oricola sp.]|uniref:anthrone oxygenase family protein n=1 Tax=Oricola sp. TaxID=1979950 RepID=UPI0025FA570E|nr:anthrone oxygenase family protein [Oricola sp.]MCI5074284.1 DUF1772 domain-containing protein [Oricola sp.]
MFEQIIPWGLAMAAVAAGLVGGVFLTFSDFVMRSLAASAPMSGMEAMQEINRKVYRSVFMVLLLGMVPVSLVIAVAATALATGSVRVWLLSGAALYLVGVFVVTAAGNVPMNKRLDVLGLTQASAQGYWQHYLRNWTWWNHVRTIASIAAAACYLAGAMLLGQTA